MPKNCNDYVGKHTVTDPTPVIARLIANGDEWLTPESVRAFNECAEAAREFERAAREAGLQMSKFGRVMLDEIGDGWTP